MRSIGIDIGSLSIKIADVEYSGKSVVLRDFLEIPFSLDVSMDKKIQIIEVLRKISSHYDPSQTRYVVGLSQDRVSIRHKTFPFRERSKIVKSLPFELEEEIPFDQDKAIFDAKIIKLKGNSSEILACAAPKKYIDELLSLLNESGIDPSVISTDGFALSNLFTNWENLPPESESFTQSSVLIEGADGVQKAVSPSDLFLHIGHSKTVLMILQNQFLLETRSINMGGREIVKAIQKTYEISFAEALKGLQEKGFLLTKNDGATKDQITFSTTIQQALAPLLLEVKKTIMEVESEFNIQIQNVHLLGGVSFLINIAPYFTQKLGVVANQINHLSTGIKVYANQTNELNKDSAIAIGLAIEGLKKPNNPPINFRKYEFAIEGQSMAGFVSKWKETFKYATIIFALFCVFAYFRQSFSLNLYDKGQEALRTIARSPTVGLKSSQTREAEIQKFISDKNKQIADYQKLSDMRKLNSPTEIISKVSQSLSSKKDFPLDIREFSVHNELVRIQGELSSLDQVVRLKNTLKGLSLDKKITDEKPTLDSKTGKIVFHVSFKVNRK